MNAILTAPLGEPEHLKEFFEILNGQGRKQEVTELSSLLSQLNQMEKQYAEVLSELQTVKGQLSAIQDKGIKTVVMNGVLKLQEKVTEAKNQLEHIKTDISNSIKESLSLFKDNGISALNKAVDFIGLRKALTDLRDNLTSSIAQTQKHINKINTVGSELHALKEHTGNLGRVLTGKETKELTQRNEDKGILAAATKQLKHSKSMLERIRQNVTHTITAVDRLEKAANKGNEKKPSVRAHLKEKSQKAPAPKSPVPQKKQEHSL